MEQKSTAVVILNWNGKNLLEQYLPSVVKYSKDESDIYVADNNSSDDSIVFLKQYFPEVNILSLDSNKGYAGGYNESLKQINSKFYVLLNSDVEVTENWIKPVIELMDNDNEIAAAQPKILSWKHKNKFEYAGAAGGWIDKYGYPFCRGRIFDTLETDNGQYDEITNIFWATGACLFVKSDIFHKLGGLDENFFAHMEEIDFCWRIQNHAYKLKFVPASKVYHLGGGSLPKNDPRKTYLNFRNNLLMMYKNLNPKESYSIFITRFLADLITVLYFFIRFKFKSGIAVIKAYFNFLIIKNKVKKTKNPKPFLSLNGVFPKSIVMSYFFKGIKKFKDL